jgi:putative FmdB family regulatory protein
MPFYEYACEKCESEFEIEQRITDEPLKSCPKCRSRRIKRLISRTSFSLKGGGWYADGYSSSSGSRKTGGNAAAGASESSSASGSSGSDKKTPASESKDSKAVA